MNSKNRLSFLDLLDSDPKTAGDQFAQYVFDFFSRRLPRHFQMWIDKGCGEHRDELLNEVYYQCSKNYFRRLRKFSGKDDAEFDRWLLRVADNIILDELRKKSKTPPPPSTSRLRWSPKVPVPPRLAATLQGCLDALSEYHRILLLARYYEERPPRDILHLVNMEDTEANRKKISADAIHALELFQSCMDRMYPRADEAYRLYQQAYKFLK